MGQASELKARTQTRGRSPRRLCLRCSPRSRSSGRDFWQLITWLWSATLLTRPIWPLMILEQSLTIPHIIPKSQFQRCFQKRQKCWTQSHKLGIGRRQRRRQEQHNNELQSQVYVYSSLSTQSGNFRKTPKPLKIPNTGKHCAQISDITNNFHIIDVIIICNRTNLCVLK